MQATTGQKPKRITQRYRVSEVVPYINWIYFFHAWGMEPRFAAIAEVHQCPACRAGWVASFTPEEQAKAREAATLYADAMAMLRQWADAPLCEALCMIADANSAYKRSYTLSVAAATANEFNRSDDRIIINGYFYCSRAGSFSCVSKLFHNLYSFRFI